MDGGEIISLVCVLSPLSAPHTLSFPSDWSRRKDRVQIALCILTKYHENIDQCFTNSYSASQ